MRAACRSATALVTVAALAGAAGPVASGTEEIAVEVELVLLADSSSSIGGNEFELQVRGYASAFRDPRVIAAILALGGNGIAVTFVQWSATFQQIDAVGWSHVRTPADAEAFAHAIETQARRFHGFGTATGAALLHGAGLFDGNGYAGRRRVIDITSDEHSNQGPHPRSVRGPIIGSGITINGLAILDDAFDLKAYFTDSVIGGPDSFVMAVDTYFDFAEAIMRKLVREISGQPQAMRPGPRLIANAARTPGGPL